MTLIETPTPLHPGATSVETAPITEPAEIRREAPQLSPELLKPDNSRAQEIQQRKEVHAGLGPLLEMKKNGLTDQEIIAWTKGWAGQYRENEQDLLEVLHYFDIAEKIIDKRFSPEQKSEIACSLAELVADGKFDAETLQALAGRVDYGGASGTFDKVAEYQPDRLGMRIYDELFKDFKGGRQNIVHILKHEIAHGLRRHGEISHDDQTQAQIDKMIDDADNLKSRETFRSIDAIDDYLAVKNKEGATTEEIEQMSRWLAEELRAEKIAAYLESNGEFGGFLNAIWNVMPPENQRKLMADKSTLDSWAEENQIIFDQIADQMKDKVAVKEKIMSSTEEADDDEFFAGGFSEPAIPDNSKNTSIQSQQNESWVALTLKLAGAAGEEVEKVMPVGELTGQK